MEAAGEAGDVFMGFVSRYWHGSYMLEPLADPSSDVARRAISTMVEVPDEG
jgi:hypothetical protein